MFRARVTLLKFMPNKSATRHGKTRAFYFLKMYLISLKKDVSFNNCLTNVCYSFNKYYWASPMCHIRETTTGFNKNKTTQKVFFFPQIFLTSLENYYIFQHFGSSINNCFQSFNRCSLERKPIICIMIPTWFSDRNFPSVHVSLNCVPMEYKSWDHSLSLNLVFLFIITIAPGLLSRR